MLRFVQFSKNQNYYIFALIAIFLLLRPIYAQNKNWMTFGAISVVTDVAFQDTNVWIGAYDNGLIKLSQKSGAICVFNVLNTNCLSREIMSVNADNKGNIFVQSGRDLFCFDGQTWQKISFPDNNSAIIKELEIDSLNNLYCVNNFSLKKYDGKETSELRICRNDSYLRVDNKGILWELEELSKGQYSSQLIAYNDGKMLDKNTLNYYEFVKDLHYTNAGTTYCFEIDKFGNKWIGTSFGLVLFDGNSLKLFTQKDYGLRSDIIKNIAIDSKNNIWINCADKGIAKYNGKTWTQFSKTNGKLISNSVSLLKTDPFGNLWIMYSNKTNIYRFNGLQWRSYNLNTSFLIPAIDDHVTSIAIDSADNKWVGTKKGGILSFSKGKWKFINTSNSLLPSNQINVLKINAKKLWVGTDRGLAIYNGVKWQCFKTPDLPSNNITCIVFDKKKKIAFIGTRPDYVDAQNGYWLIGGGLAAYDEKKWSEIKVKVPPEYCVYNNGLPRSDNLTTIESIVTDTLGNKWVLASADGSAIVKISENNSNQMFYPLDEYNNNQAFYRLDKNEISDTLKNEIRQNWFANNDNGDLAKFISKFSEFKYVWAQLDKRTVFDKKNNLWFFSEQKLLKLDNSSDNKIDVWTPYDNYGSYHPYLLGALIDNIITCIACDKNNNIWIGTEQGLGVFNEDGVEL